MTIAGLLPPSSSVTGVRCFGRGLHDDPADGAVAGVEDVVERCVEQRGGLVDAARHDLHRALVEVSRDQLGERVGGGRRHLGRLDDGGVAGRERGDERTEQRAAPGSSTGR